jgi:hypothetical protein
MAVRAVDRELVFWEDAPRERQRRPRAPAPRRYARRLPQDLEALSADWQVSGYNIDPNQIENAID